MFTGRHIVGVVMTDELRYRGRICGAKMFQVAVAVFGSRGGAVVEQPGLDWYAGQLYPVPGTDSQAASHQVLAGGGHSGGEVEAAATDGLVALEGNITADQVVEQDAQAPHSQLVSVITLLNYPFWRRVDMSSWESFSLFLINGYTGGHL